MSDGATRPRLLVGLTGGIAAGKSTVARMLAEAGAALVDADQLAREVVAPGQPALAAIVRAFGADVLDAEGALDRKRLARRVFRDAVARRQLEAITHPAIAAASRARIAELADSGAQVVVYEAALLVEVGRQREMDRLIVVIADDAVRIARLMARERLSREQAQQRIAAQLPQADKAALADYLVDNSGSLAQTRARLGGIWRALQAEIR